MSSMKPREPGSLKEVQDRLVAELGGLVAAAEASGGLIGKSHLHRCTDPDEPRSPMPLDVLVAMETALGRPLVSLWLIRRLGWEAFPLAPAGEDGWSRDLAEACRDWGEAAAILVDALADGTVTRVEAAQGLAQLDRALTAMSHLRGRLVAVLEGEG